MSEILAEEQTVDISPAAQIKILEERRDLIQAEIGKILSSPKYYARDLRRDKLLLQQLYRKLEAFDFVIKDWKRDIGS